METMGEFPVPSFWMSSLSSQDVSEQAVGSIFPPCASWPVESKSYNYEYPTVSHVLQDAEGRIFTSQPRPAACQEVAAYPGYIDVGIEYSYGNGDHNSDSRRSELTSTKLLRRRAQNRASQRAYRNRRDERVKELEGKLEDMISQYDKLTKEYAELSKTHASLKDKKQQWMGKVERGSNTRITDDMRGSTEEISSINDDASLGGDGGFSSMA